MKEKRINKETHEVCKSCEKYGTAEIVAGLIKQDVIADLKHHKSKRTRQIKEFIDEDHDVQMEYYEVFDQDFTVEQTLIKMQQLIKQDPTFLDPYLVASDILYDMKRYDESEKVLKEAYEIAIYTIADNKGRWPKEMLWGFLENRHIMRAIEQYGSFCWEAGRIEEALDIFRKLLKTNPQDNQGIRFYILAIRMNLGIDAWEKPFCVKEKGKILGLDAQKVWEWFDTNAPAFEDDFGWLLDYYKKIE